jgi:hypothetical protein
VTNRPLFREVFAACRQFRVGEVDRHDLSLAAPV